MTKDQKVLSEISKELNIDVRVVSLVAHYPFHFVVDKIRDKEDYKPTMFRYMGKFLPRFNVIKK